MITKHLVIASLFLFGYGSSSAQSPQAGNTKTDIPKQVEAGCGQCMFKMKGDDCDLAVRINGKAYFVDGTKIDDHGDAHANDGFCNRIRQASVTGKIVKDRFVASSFQLLPEKKD